ncbi:response regulator [Pedobacter sp. G11]|uniref:response regulator n=1 Tax=Pedobacter sp. G11 TaxID=2482728 RepID=UPI000F5F76EE|nr:response regulator [Pedobacter sp. G11]AZI26386.1 response regulator [Pedobacter sp. G11]
MKKILIADQDPQVLLRLEWLLNKHWIIVEKVESAKALYTAVGFFRPDLIIMEISFGHLDGRLVCNDLKNAAQTAHIPIVLLTTMTYQKIGEIPCEADAIIGKPLNEFNLLRTITDLVSCSTSFCQQPIK